MRRKAEKSTEPKQTGRECRRRPGAGAPQGARARPNGHGAEEGNWHQPDAKGSGFAICLRLSVASAIKPASGGATFDRRWRHPAAFIIEKRAALLHVRDIELLFKTDGLAAVPTVARRGRRLPNEPDPTWH